MSVVPISKKRLTPEERKGLEDRERRRSGAELQLATAQNILKQAHAEVARARREYKRALNELVTYQERIGL
jgi:hypothetical protein